jgi:hypothetical protein
MMALDYPQVLLLMSKTTVFLWLFIATMIDIFYPLFSKSFFINTVDKIDGDQMTLRGFQIPQTESNRSFILTYVKKIYYFFLPEPIHTEEFSAKCPAQDQIYNCPLFKGLTTFLKNQRIILNMLIKI